MQPMPNQQLERLYGRDQLGGRAGTINHVHSITYGIERFPGDEAGNIILILIGAVCKNRYFSARFKIIFSYICPELVKTMDRIVQTASVG